MVRKGALIIDAGIVREGRLVCGDVDYINVSKKAFVTKVPYGVGQMTVLEFIDNIYRAFLLKMVSCNKKRKFIFELIK